MTLPVAAGAALPTIDANLAARLLEHEVDFRVSRRDQTLDAPVQAAPLDAIEAHAEAIAGSSAADDSGAASRSSLTF